MSGWAKVAAATLVAVIGLVGVNLAIWRRMRATVGHAPPDEEPSDQISADVV